MSKDSPKATELNIGDVIAVPGSTGYNYETGAWPDEIPTMPGKVEVVHQNCYGRYSVHGHYLGDKQPFYHYMSDREVCARLYRAI